MSNDLLCSCQDELEEIAAAHEADLAESESDSEDDEETKRKKAEARVREDMEDMGFD